MKQQHNKSHYRYKHVTKVIMNITGIIHYYVKVSLCAPPLPPTPLPNSTPKLTTASSRLKSFVFLSYPSNSVHEGFTVPFESYLMP